MELEMRALGPERESLARFKAKQWTRPAMSWYKALVPSEFLKTLHERNDLWGTAQTLGFLGCDILLPSLNLRSVLNWFGWVQAYLFF